MTASTSFLSSTIGRKYIVAVTALFWSLFVMIHMLGNLLIFAGPEIFNRYSHSLTSNPLIYVAESLLAILLIAHAAYALSLKFRNIRTKPSLYAVSPSQEKSASLSSKTMAYTGSAILAFVIWHLSTFKFGPQYMTEYDGLQMRDLFRLVVEKFHNPYYVSSYCFVMIIIGFHLFHGVKSIFQSLGINHPRYNSFFKYFGYLYSFVVAGGFFAQPLYVFFMR